MSGATIGGVVGAVVGFFVGSPQLGWMIGSAIGGALDPQVIKAPSIGDAQRQSSQPGVPRPVVYGHPAPFAGNIIDGEAKARKITHRQSQGKGGGPKVESERFLLTYAIRICEGPAKVLRIWRNGELVYDVRTLEDMPTYEGGSMFPSIRYAAEIRAKSRQFRNRVRIYEGTETQLPDPALEALHGVGNTPYYRGTCYMVIEDDDVTDTRGAAAQYRFEVVRSGTESGTAEVVPDYPWPASGGANVEPQFGHQVWSVWRTVSVADVKGVFRIGVESMGDAPGRIRVHAGESIIYDSGWVGDAAYRDDLAVALGGVSEIVRQEGDGTTTWISDPTTVGGYMLRLGSSASIAPGPVYSPTIEVGTYGDLQIESVHAAIGRSAMTGTLQYPDPGELPDTVSYVEDMGLLLGSDGMLYAPSWMAGAVLTLISPDTVILGTVVTDIAARCNVPADKLDVSALTDVIPGLLVAEQFTGADTIRPLQQAFFFDMPEVDGKLRAVKRGGPAVATVTDDDRVDSEEPQEVVRAQIVEYPLKVSVVTQDPAAEYAAVPQTSGRDSPDFRGTSEVTIQLPVPFGATESARIAHKLHKVLHAQAEGRVELELPDSFSHVVPGDPFTYRGRRWLLEDVRYSDGVVHWKAVQDRASAYVSTASGIAPRPPAVPTSGLRGPTVLHVMDLPAWRSSDDDPGLYVAVGGKYEAWDGARLFLSTDDGANYAFVRSFGPGAIHGSVVEAVSPWASSEYPSPQTITVTLNESPDAVTRADVMRYANRAAVQLSGGAWEILQFESVTDEGDGVYTLGGLLRGRYDTTHGQIPEGAPFVVLNGAVAFLPAQEDMLGTTVLLKAVGVGVDDASVSPVSYTIPDMPQSVREWPVHMVRAGRNAGGDLEVTWAGRARLGADAAPSHSQHFGGYRVTVSDGVISKAWDTQMQGLQITAAEQAAVFGTFDFEPEVSVVPLSKLVVAAAAGAPLSVGTLADWTVVSGGGGWSIADGVLIYSPIAGRSAIGRLDFNTRVPFVFGGGHIEASARIQAIGQSLGAIAVAGYDAAGTPVTQTAGVRIASGRSAVVAGAPDFRVQTGAVSLIAFTNGTAPVHFTEIRTAAL